MSLDEKIAHCLGESPVLLCPGGPQLGVDPTQQCRNRAGADPQPLADLQITASFGAKLYALELAIAEGRRDLFGQFGALQRLLRVLSSIRNPIQVVRSDFPGRGSSFTAVQKVIAQHSIEPPPRIVDPATIGALHKVPEEYLLNGIAGCAWVMGPSFGVPQELSRIFFVDLGYLRFWLLRRSAKSRLLKTAHCSDDMCKSRTINLIVC